MAVDFSNLRNASGRPFAQKKPGAPKEEVPFLTTHQVPFPEDRVPFSDALYRLSGVRGPLSRICFFDTETTGLSGGAGSLIFQAGIGLPGPDGLTVHQYFIGTPAMEPRLLQALYEIFGERPVVVTYNGKSFDIPLLMNRYILNRFDEPELETPDLLHAARSVWRHRMPQFRLGDVENHILGIRRQGDLPGALVPAVYRDYLMGRGRGQIRQVLRHNLQDIVSLAYLLQRLASGCLRMDNPHFRLAMARKLFQAGADRECCEMLKHASIESASGSLVAEAGRLHARALKRMGSRREAAALWTQQDTVEAGEELAKYHEHDRRDYQAALNLTEMLLNRSGLNRRRRESLQHRRNRLRQKIRRHSAK